MKKVIRIRVVEPAGRASSEALRENIGVLTRAGFDVLFDPIARDEDYPLYAASDEVRARCLSQALTEAGTDVVMAARGGYGASSLLRRLNWSAIESAAPKLLVGFSDISAVHSAMFTKLGRAGLHGPMPGSTLFGDRQNENPVLLDLLSRGLPWRSSVELNLVKSSTGRSVTGWLFGGNLAVVSSLIGTPWFPRNVSGSIVFIEDVNVNAGSAGRDFDQWIESGKTIGMKALVIGAFTKSGEGRAGQRATIIAELARRVDCPVFETEQFGHCAPNLPIPVGACATIEPGADSNKWHLNWQINDLACAEAG